VTYALETSVGFDGDDTSAGHRTGGAEGNSSWPKSSVVATRFYNTFLNVIAFPVSNFECRD